MRVLRLIHHCWQVLALLLRLSEKYFFSKPNKKNYYVNSEIDSKELGIRYADFCQDLNILVVDDQDICCKMVAEALSAFKFNIHIAHDGVAAIEYLKSHTYSLIIMDLRMPKMDGVSAVRAIRSRKYFIGQQCDYSSYVPIIAYTSLSEQECLNVVLDAGMNGVIQKPCNYNSVRNIVEEFILRHPHSSKPIHLSNDYFVLLDSSKIRCMLIALFTKLYFFNSNVCIESTDQLTKFIDYVNRYPVRYAVINIDSFSIGVDEIKLLQSIGVDIIVLSDIVSHSYLGCPVYSTNINRDALANILHTFVNEKNKNVSILNLEVLSRIDDVGENLTVDLLHSFLEELAVYQKDIILHHSNRDIASLHKVVRSMEGSVSTLGMDALRFILSSEYNTYQSLEWLNKFKLACTDVKHAIEQYINQ